MSLPSESPSSDSSPDEESSAGGLSSVRFSGDIRLLVRELLRPFLPADPTTSLLILGVRFSPSPPPP
eukprot:CAMPEP_0206267062 /NCGR_PEP_ID=MMETSP0047_2-20121206/30939_1 /ASSEMBLY_ACC=CAM_ASM_000192 /TAXON_ID=195065 /ORGANISM="Chroomonas mesostigmatica_cf, Strain CCMP1168" /LENGTH=66 /DNA_ID=CAMNT_0053695221 /DNA_START=40 /DNA_END=237 /DNA_ORIENTATION=+